jgi:hypothetical protein
MQHKLITTKNYLLVVDDSEIKEGDWCLADIPAGDFYGIVKYNGAFAKHYYKKIIAHLPKNSPILEGVDLLPPLEDEVEKLADEIVGDSIYYEEDRVNLSDGMDLFMLGYNKFKEKYKYTEEDLRRAIILAREQHLVKYTDNDYDFDHKEDEIIQSIQQPKYPVAFKCEIEYTGFQEEGDLEEPKSFINSQGLTQWVGRYIYE